MPLADASADHALGLDESLVHVVHAAVGVFAFLVEETREVLLPLVVGGQPTGRGRAVPDARQGEGDASELSARLQPGPHAGEPEYVGLHVEQAALDAGVGPHGLRGLHDA
ncbi:hypothetical protein BHAP_2171, partial [Bifidobacterium hapali]